MDVDWWFNKHITRYALGIDLTSAEQNIKAFECTCSLQKWCASGYNIATMINEEAAVPCQPPFLFCCHTYLLARKYDNTTALQLDPSLCKDSCQLHCCSRFSRNHVAHNTCTEIVYILPLVMHFINIAYHRWSNMLPHLTVNKILVTLQQTELDHSMQHCMHTSHAALPSSLHTTAEHRWSNMLLHLTFNKILVTLQQTELASSPCLRRLHAAVRDYKPPTSAVL